MVDCISSLETGCCNNSRSPCFTGMPRLSFADFHDSFTGVVQSSQILRRFGGKVNKNRVPGASPLLSLRFLSRVPRPSSAWAGVFVYHTPVIMGRVALPRSPKLLSRVPRPSSAWAGVFINHRLVIIGGLVSSRAFGDSRRVALPRSPKLLSRVPRPSSAWAGVFVYHRLVT